MSITIADLDVFSSSQQLSAGPVTVSVQVEGRRMKLSVSSPGSGGSSYWDRCSVDRCVGEAVNGGMCLNHLSRQDIHTYVDQILASYPRGALRVTGVSIDDTLKEALLSSQLFRSMPVAPHIQVMAAVLETDLDLSEKNFGSHLGLHGVVFDGALRLTNCGFLQGLNLTHCYQRAGGAGIDVSHARIAGDVRLDGSRSSQQPLNFLHTRFDSSVSAQGLTSGLNLSNATIGHELAIRNSAPQFLIFPEGTVGGGLMLDNSTFSFIDAKNLRASGASQIGPVTAGNRFDLTGARFEQRLSLRVTTDRLSLDDSHFYNGGVLRSEGAGQVSIRGLRTEGPLVIQGSFDGKTSLQSLENTDAGELTLADLDLTGCVFEHAHRLDALRLEATNQLALYKGRRRIHDEELLKAKADRHSALKIAALYRALRQSYEIQGNEPGAADFYYGEMEMRRLGTDRTSAEGFLIRLYWVVSGYGLRASRPLGFLVALWVAAAILFEKLGLQAHHGGWLRAAVDAAQSAYPSTQTIPYATTVGTITSLFLRVAAPALAALAIIGLRSRVKR
jgi:hypothetical protein